MVNKLLQLRDLDFGDHNGEMVGDIQAMVTAGWDSALRMIEHSQGPGTIKIRQTEYFGQSVRGPKNHLFRLIIQDKIEEKRWFIR